MSKKNALGRGLGALIDSPQSDLEGADKVQSVNEIDVNAIEVNPFQPRTGFDEEALAELAGSIAKLGIIQPITVREIRNGRYQIITGERRWRAAIMAGLENIPAYVRTADDQGLLEMALVENIQREDLDAIEVAISYQRLIEECKITQEDLSGRVGKKRSTITNYIRLLKLPAEIQLGIKDKKLSMGHARALVNIEDKGAQLKIFHKLVDQDLSVRATEEMVRKLAQESNPDEKPPAPETLPREYEDLKEHLARFFETNIDFRRNNKGSGKIVIPFKSDEDLERIMGILDRINA
jgi:ParB family transcriptional regulator, chromosome partitioning protein